MMWTNLKVYFFNGSHLNVLFWKKKCDFFNLLPQIFLPICCSGSRYFLLIRVWEGKHKALYLLHENTTIYWLQLAKTSQTHVTRKSKWLIPPQNLTPFGLKCMTLSWIDVICIFSGHELGMSVQLAASPHGGQWKSLIFINLQCLVIIMWLWMSWCL